MTVGLVKRQVYCLPDRIHHLPGVGTTVSEDDVKSGCDNRCGLVGVCANEESTRTYEAIESC